MPGFAILKHIHKSSNDARVVVKVLVNKEDDIPDDVIVSPGDSSCAPSWTMPIFILHAQDLSVYGDEDALPPVGPLHPMPNPAPRWVGLDGELSQSVPPNAEVPDDMFVGNMPRGDPVGGSNADVDVATGAIVANLPDVVADTAASAAIANPMNSV